MKYLVITFLLLVTVGCESQAHKDAREFIQAYINTTDTIVGERARLEDNKNTISVQIKANQNLIDQLRQFQQIESIDSTTWTRTQKVTIQNLRHRLAKTLTTYPSMAVSMLLDKNKKLMELN